MNEEIIEADRKMKKKVPAYNGLKKQVTRSCLSMRIKYCRKIYASWLRQSGIEAEIIDMLQGRIGKNIFIRHYMTPSNSYRDKIIDAVDRLREQIIASKTLT